MEKPSMSEQHGHHEHSPSAWQPQQPQPDPSQQWPAPPPPIWPAPQHRQPTSASAPQAQVNQQQGHPQHQYTYPSQSGGYGHGQGPAAMQPEPPRAAPRLPAGRTSNRRRFLLGVGAALPVVGALGFLASRLGRSTSNQAGGPGNGGTDPDLYNPSSLPTAAQNPNAITTADVRALIASANTALKSRDEKSFVAAYSSGATAKQASRMFVNIGKFDFDFLEYQLIGDGTREFGSGTGTTLGVDVALVHQVSGVDVAHVAMWYRWELSKQGASAPLVIESVTGSPSLHMGGAKYVYYPAPWDSSYDITVIKQGNAILCAETPADAALMKKHAAEAVAAIQNNQDGWASGGGKSGQLAGALMMAAHTRDDFYKWWSGSANQYGNEAGLTIPLITADAMASGSPIMAFGGSRITLDVTTSFFTVDRGGDSVISILQHEDAHKLTFPLLSAAQSSVPNWVVEGFADYMATRTIAGGLKAYFRIPDIKSFAAGRTATGVKWDGTLPDDGEVYDNADATVESGSYGLATMAYYYIASIKGLPGVIAFLQANYQAPATNDGTENGPDNLAGAFQSVLGMSQDAFVAGWLGFIKSQIGVSPA